MSWSGWLRLPAASLLAGLALAYGITLLWPTNYIARASVFVSVGAASRVVRIEERGTDAARAVERVRQRLASYLGQQAEVLDEPVVLPSRPNLPLNLALGGGAGLALGATLLGARLRRRQPVRSERELAGALGEPLLAARPIRDGNVRPLCEQLLAHWFNGERHALPIVSAQPGEGRSRLAAQLAHGFAALGARTLLIDGDFRGRELHRAFGLPAAPGLADFLEGRRVSLAAADANLSVLVAGDARSDPLELLVRPRLQAFLAQAARHYRVILIDTPAAARGPDFQMYAALAGGALVVARDAAAEQAGLRALHRALEDAAARLVATVIRQD